jgi:hypothetical protein
MTNPSGGGGGDERRKNSLLRLLIDDMLEHVREVNKMASVWTPEEREKAEAELDRIMSQVRGAATRRPGPT